MLKLQHRLPVYPIVVNLSRGARPLMSEQYVDCVYDRDVNVFRYDAAGLPDLNADDYQTSENPLTPALSALVKTSKRCKVVRKYQSLRAVPRARVDEARRALLWNVVETYRNLDTEQQAAFLAVTATLYGQEVRSMISTYSKLSKRASSKQLSRRQNKA